MTNNSNLIHENDFMKVEYLQLQNLVITSYKGYAEDDIIKEGLLKSIELVRKNNAKNMVFDNTNFQGASPELQTWVQEEFFVLAYNEGARNFAIVVPEEIFAAFSVDMAISEAVNYMNVEKFYSPSTAIEWTQSFS